jgi:hypothetical protein
MTVAVEVERAGASSGKGRAWPPWASWSVAVGVPTLLVAAHSLVYGQWLVDDAGITFAYARSIATGAGPVLQPGVPPVEGYSNPAWLALLVVGRWFGLFDRGTWFGIPDLVAFPKAVALACCAGMIAGFHTVSRLVSPRPVLVTVAAGAITAAVPSFVIWSMSGLENPLLAVTVVTLAAVLARGMVSGTLLESRTAAVCGALAALAALTRPDGLIYAAAFPTVVVLLRPGGLRGAGRSVGVSLGAFAVPVGLYELFRVREFGDWLPNTARAKGQTLPGLASLDQPGGLLAYFGWLLAVVAVGVVVWALSGRSAIPSTTRTVVQVLLILLGSGVVAFAVLAPDWMPQYRFATVVWPLVALTATVAVAEVLPSLSRRRRLLVGSLVVVALVASAASWMGDAATHRARPTSPLCYVAVEDGYLVNSYAALLGVQEGTLLASNAGGTGLTSRLQLLDLAGLADSRIARYWATGNRKGLVDYVFDEAQPTFVKLWVGWGGPLRSALERDPRLLRDYVLVFAPEPGSGVWVRRDAAGLTPGGLAAARAFAATAFPQRTRGYGPGTGWPCPSRLVPASYVPAG